MLDDTASALKIFLRACPNEIVHTNMYSPRTLHISRTRLKVGQQYENDLAYL